MAQRAFKTTKSEHNIEIKNVANNRKDLIKQPDFCNLKVIPKLNTSTLIVGRSGSGKSVLLANLLNECYKDVFKLKILISPTGSSDDVQKSMGCNMVITDLREASEFLDALMKIQEKTITAKGAHKAPLVCIVFDDVMGEKFLGTAEFTACFTRSRHYNFTIFALSQKYSGIPKKCRLQLNNLIFYASQDSEINWIVEDFCPANYSKKAFASLIKWTTSEKFSFMYINMSADESERYRKGFNEIIAL